MRRQKLSTLNVGNLLVVLGVGWLGFGFWLPYATADRVFRIESRAADVAAKLCTAAADRERLDWSNEAHRDDLLADVNAARGLDDPTSSLFLRAATAPKHLRRHCFCFQGKHYYYMVTHPPRRFLESNKKIESPRKDKLPPEEPPPPIDLPVEVYAWPRKLEGGGRTVFFFPSDASAAFTRNLENRDVGMRRAPHPGDGRVAVELPHGDYRGQDDQRWIYSSRRP